MAEFTVIETQEQFDNAIKARLDREKSKFSEQIAELEGFKTKYEESQKQIEDLSNALNSANEKVSGFESQIAERDSKIKDYAVRAEKTQIANEMGLSFDAIEFLQGEDTESIRKSAETLKSLVGTSKVAPLASGEPQNIDPKDAALRGMLANLKQ